MKRILEVCLVAFTFASLAPSAFAQAAADAHLQKGISVDLPVTRSAVAIPEADKEDAIVVVVTGNGDIFLGTDRTSVTALPDKITSALSGGPRVVFVKADARAPFSTIVSILDSLNAAGLRRFALLTAQRDFEKTSVLVSPRGLEMQITPLR